MDKISEMKNLFDRWKLEQENEQEPCYTPGVVEKHYFTLDGFINKEKYDNADKKILFILKEPHILEKREKGIDDNQINWYMNYIEWLEDTNTKRIKDSSYIRENVSRMSAYIIDKEIVSDRVRLKEALESIAVININKRGGSGDCDTRELYEKYYLKYKQFIIEQIQICNPEIIISMCGHEIFEDLNKEFLDKNIKMVSLVHPARGKWIKIDDDEVDKGFRKTVKTEEIQNESIENKIRFLNENISRDIKFNKTTFKFFMQFVKRYTDKEIK